MKKNTVSIIISCIILSGCAGFQTKFSSLESGQNQDEIRKQLGKPYYVDSLPNIITRYDYKALDFETFSNETWHLYFKNNKLIRKSKGGDPFTQLDDSYALGLISQQEYEGRRSQMTQNFLQVYPILQNMQMNQQNQQYQNQMLDIEKSRLKLEQKQANKVNNTAVTNGSYNTNCRQSPNGDINCQSNPSIHTIDLRNQPSQ